MPYAGFWRRFAAMIIDSIVLNILLSPLMGLMAFNTVKLTQDSLEGMTDAQILAVLPMIMTALAISFISFVLQLVYYAYMESSKYQATLGKMALGILVTDTAGNRISFGRAAARNIGKVLSGMILMVGYLMAAFTARKQALHDLMAGTLVMRKDAVGVSSWIGTAAQSQTTPSGRRPERNSKEFIPERYEDDRRDE